MSQRAHQGGVAGTRWTPGQYLKFSQERLRPALELLDRIPLEAPDVIYDLGCGSGHITRLLAKRWSSSRVYGIDPEFPTAVSEVTSGMSFIPYFGTFLQV